uniref:Uncharacterized protein n=1 Tax=Timema douglasi TaxID=61478 RepID=A0A7R8VK37_TIMDO|nr:unnamed protein product [Timema douglasi]
MAIHPTEILTSISPSSAVELNTTSALANYATEAVFYLNNVYSSITKICDGRSAFILGFDVAVANKVVVFGLPRVSVAVDERDVGPFRNKHLLLGLLSQGRCSYCRNDKLCIPQKLGVTLTWTHSCCLRGFLRGLISIGGFSISSTISFLTIAGRESSPASLSPGDEVAEIVVDPPEEFPPLPRESGRRGDGGETGEELRAANIGKSAVSSQPAPKKPWGYCSFLELIYLEMLCGMSVCTHWSLAAWSAVAEMAEVVVTESVWYGQATPLQATPSSCSDQHHFDLHPSLL